MTSRNAPLVGVAVALAAFRTLSAPFAEWLEGCSPSGATVRIWATGDEYSASFESEDGHAAVFDSASRTYFYADADGSGALVSTGMAVGDETESDRARLASIPLHLRDVSEAAAAARAELVAETELRLGITERWSRLKSNARARRAAAKGPQPAPPSMPTLGSVVGLTLLIDFPVTNGEGVVTGTLAGTYHPNVTKEQLDELLNGEDCTLYGNASSVRRYFEDQSCGRMSYTNVVLGWFMAEHPREYYDRAEPLGPAAQELIGEVLSQIADDPDYETRYLPLLRRLSYSGLCFRSLNVWYAGPTANAWNEGLWPHKYELSSQQQRLLHVEVDGSERCFCAYQITPVTMVPSIGVFCHENGHMICGFPDLYDMQYGSGGAAGVYSPMASSGTGKPVNFDAYLRAAAGWVDPMELPSEPGLVEVTNSLDCVWRYSHPTDPTQYYLIENRQRSGRDANLPGGGILIWRCDEYGSNTYPGKASGFSGAAANRVVSELALEQADGLYELERHLKSSDANDLWFRGNSASGYRGVFNSESTPCAKWRDATDAGIFLSKFSANGDVMTFYSGGPGDATLPGAVAGLTATPCYGRIALSWEAEEVSDEYAVYRSESDSLASAVQIASVAEESYVDVVPAEGVTYRYWVAGVNTLGEGTKGLSASACSKVASVQGDWFIDATYGSDSKNGRSWATAKKTIQSAAYYAAAGETVVVAPGRYTPITATNNRSFSIVALEGPDATFIDGGFASRCAALSQAQTGTNTVLVGFSLVNGRLTGAFSNGAGSFGGTLRNCVISNCHAGAETSTYAYGGGAYYGNLFNCRLVGNSVTGQTACGGGASNSRLYNCLVEGNEARSTSASGHAQGGGVASALSYGCTVVRNSASNSAGGSAEGGGTYGGSHYNSIFWDNASSVGPGIAVDSTGGLRLYSCCTQERNDRCDNATIADDPLFVDPARGDWRLGVGSPCIDAGYNYYDRTETDLDGGARVQNYRIDIGAYEGGHVAVPTFTATTPVPVPHVWLDAYPALLASAGGDYELAGGMETGKRGPGGRAMHVWEDYLAGTDPMRTDEVFKSWIRMEDGRPVVEWTPDLNTNGVVRLYRIWGRTNLTDNVEWMCPTNSGHRFFKVTVELP